MSHKIALLTLAAGLWLSGQSTKAGPTVLLPMAAQNHTMILTVTDARTHVPLSGAFVTGSWHYGAYQQGPLPARFTDESGETIITGPASPYWEVSVTLSGYRACAISRFAQDARYPDNLSVQLRK